jgi:hypothetical protein
MGDISIEDKKVKTPKFRVSYPNVFKAKENDDGEERFGLTMLFEEGTDLKAMKKVAMNAALEKYGSKDKLPKKFKMPFRDGNEEKPDDENYQDVIFVSCTSKKKPQIVDGDLDPITEEDEFYPGCYARATLIAFHYKMKGNEGVSFALQNLQKLGDGETLTKKRNAADDFGDDDEDSKDSKNYKKTKSKKKSRDDDDDDDDDGYGF